MRFSPSPLPTSFGQFQFNPDFVTAAIAAGKAFAAYAQATAFAAQKGVIELNNPAASGINAFVFKVEFVGNGGPGPVLYADGTTINPAATGFNLKLGGAVSACKVAGQTVAAPTGSRIGGSWATNSFGYLAVVDRVQVIVPAGHNLQLQGDTANVTISANYWWIEL